MQLKLSNQIPWFESFCSCSVLGDGIHRLMRQADLIHGLGVANNLIKLFVAGDRFDLVRRAAGLGSRRLHALRKP
ncbi:hypothetical protein [Mesorhizobium sp. RCC_202]|uniref:hypothetical protein n=1 Tax=Mesorhizobium sp. RCC_202 TaxID=3239222 RepID=UPI003525E6F5